MAGWGWRVAGCAVRRRLCTMCCAMCCAVCCAVRRWFGDFRCNKEAVPVWQGSIAQVKIVWASIGASSGPVNAELLVTDPWGLTWRSEKRFRA